jgi:hypothetical protein
VTEGVAAARNEAINFELRIGACRVNTVVTANTVHFASTFRIPVPHALLVVGVRGTGTISRMKDRFDEQYCG